MIPTEEDATISIGNVQKEDEHYHVPDNYDRTENDGNSTLDNYILDEDIIRILEGTMKHFPGKCMYKNNQALSKCLFSKPYPDVAINALGFPNHNEQTPSRN